MVDSLVERDLKRGALPFHQAIQAVPARKTTVSEWMGEMKKQRTAATPMSAVRI
jgi:hypothetical protein